MTLKFLLLSEASTIAIGSAMEGVALPDSCFQASIALGEGADLSSQLVTQTPACIVLWQDCLQDEVKKRTTNPEISHLLTPFQLSAINCSINLLLLIKSVIFSLLIPLQVF